MDFSTLSIETSPASKDQLERTRSCLHSSTRIKLSPAAFCATETQPIITEAVPGPPQVFGNDKSSPEPLMEPQAPLEAKFF